MLDRIDTIGKGTLLQHGKFNDRIYLMKLHAEDAPGILDVLRGMAREHAYSKIFCKVPARAAPLFFSDGFMMEAYIPRFYREKEAVFFLSKFLDSDRLLGVEHDSLEALAGLFGSRISPPVSSEKPGIRAELKRLHPADAAQIAGIYRKVFLSYPFPIHDPDYIIKNMKQDVQYYGFERKGRLIALASAEIDRKGRNAEMTDFATLPDYRGNRLSIHLLKEMEQEMKQQHVSTLHTIARLNSCLLYTSDAADE